MTANKDAALAWLDAVQRGDVDDYRDTMTEDAIHEVMGTSVASGVLSRDESAKLIGQLVHSFSDGIRFEVDEITADEDRVAVMMHGFANLPTGGSYNNIYHVLFRIRDGKVSHIYEFADTKLVDETFAKLATASGRG